MSEGNNLWRQYGGYLILVVIAVLLLLGGVSGAFGDLFAAGEGTGVPPAGAPGTTTTQPTPTANPTQAASFDIDDMPVLADNSLAPAPIPITYKAKTPSHQFITYTVEAGDTPNKIAERFGIQPETLLGGNAFLSEESSLLQTGSVLTILPIDGVLHTVSEGETLEGLSQRYGVPVEDIIAYEPNNLEFPYRLEVGTDIMVPGAVRDVFVWEPPSLPAASGSSPEALQGLYVAVPGTGTFVWPVNSRNFTQYYWYGHQAIDVALPVGSAVYASDTGTVTYASWSPYCYGNLIVINHGNGFETFYAHLSGFNVSPGQTVYQGNLIGWTGSTGCSSGPHIHFEIRSNRTRYDPLQYLP